MVGAAVPRAHCRGAPSAWEHQWQGGAAQVLRCLWRGWGAIDARALREHPRDLGFGAHPPH
eukprot:9058955-Pyramimonas_sp.AAC.1